MSCPRTIHFPHNESQLFRHRAAIVHACDRPTGEAVVNQRTHVMMFSIVGQILLIGPASLAGTMREQRVMSGSWRSFRTDALADLQVPPDRSVPSHAAC